MEGTVAVCGEIMHGKTSAIHHDALGVFRKNPDQFLAARYHSLVGTVDTLSSCLTVTAKTSKGLIMGACHKLFRVEGVQFHPESILSEHGYKLLHNFLVDNRAVV